MAKPNYRHQKKLREAQRLTRQAEKLQKRQGARAEGGDSGHAQPEGAAQLPEGTVQKPAE